MSPSETNQSKRALSAIAFTDAVGFSARASTDEAGALEALRRDLDRIREFAQTYDGQVVKSTGDGLMVRFDSAVQAVEWALDVQRAFAQREADGFVHRIGIHLGDVLLTEDDALGDGVNIASRLQQVAQPGGVCISQTVYDVVKSRIVPLHVVPMGAQQLKNIESPIQAYQIASEGETKRPTIKTRARSEGTPRRTITWIALLIVAIAASQVYVIRNLQNRPPVREIVRTVPVPTPGGVAPATVASPDTKLNVPASTKEGASNEGTAAPEPPQTSAPNPDAASREATSKGIAEVLDMAKNTKDLTRRLALLEGFDLDSLDDEGDLPPEAKEHLQRIMGEVADLRAAMPEYREARERFMPTYDFAGFIAWLNERGKVKETSLGRGLVSRLAQLEDLRRWMADRLAETGSDSPLTVQESGESVEIWGAEGARVAIRRGGVVTQLEWSALEPSRFYAIGRELLDGNGRGPLALRQTRALDVFRREYDLRGVTTPRGRPASRVSAEPGFDPPRRPLRMPPPPGS